MKTSAPVRVKALLKAEIQLKQYFDILRNTLIGFREKERINMLNLVCANLTVQSPPFLYELNKWGITC